MDQTKIIPIIEALSQLDLTLDRDYLAAIYFDKRYKELDQGQVHYLSEKERSVRESGVLGLWRKLDSVNRNKLVKMVINELGNSVS